MVQFSHLPLCGRNSASCMEYYTILYMLLIVTQMMLDAAFFQTIINIPSSDNPAAQLNIYQCIIVPIHCLQATLQFLFGFDLFKANVRKSYRRARNWQMIFFGFVAVEVSVFLAYIALASFFSIFTYVTAFAIVFKVYLIWPLRLFLEECRDVCVPLAQAASTFSVHLAGGDPLAKPASIVSNGPPAAAVPSSSASCYNSTNNVNVNANP